MNIPGDLLKVTIGINEKGFIPALKEMPRPLISTIIIGCVRYIKMTHEFLEVCQWGFDQKVKVIPHQDVGQNLHLIDFT
jgi:hypothetical protein